MSTKSLSSVAHRPQMSLDRRTVHDERQTLVSRALRPPDSRTQYAETHRGIESAELPIYCGNKSTSDGARRRRSAMKLLREGLLLSAVVTMTLTALMVARRSGP